MAEREGPAYVAIITDGNGRWAKARGLSVGDGHRAGAENVRARLRDAVELGIRELTVYAFSTENWSRSPAEVKYLIDLIARVHRPRDAGAPRRERAPALHRRARRSGSVRTW